MPEILRLNAGDSDFQKKLEQLLAWESVSDEAVHQTVKSIIESVRSRG